MDDKKKIQQTIDGLNKALGKAQQQLKDLDEPTYSVGDRFIMSGGTKCILAWVNSGFGAGLICLRTGCRWQVPASVRCGIRITQEEFDEISNGDKFSRYWDSQNKKHTGDKK